MELIKSMPTVNLKSEVKEELTKLKKELNFSAYTDVVNYLLLERKKIIKAEK